jgi:hypothetical protein
MRLLKYLLAALAIVLLIIAAVDLSARAFAAAFLAALASYAVRRRLVAFWWLVCALLAFSFYRSARGVFRTPQTSLAVMCALIALLLTALIASWWWRQRSYFTRRDEQVA